MKIIISCRLLAAIVIVVMLSSATAAQWGSLSGPILGYVFDGKAGRLRPVNGIPGSASIGDPVDIGSTTSPFLTLGADHAFASTDVGLVVLTLSPDATRVLRTPIPGVAANPARSAVSPQTTSAAFYDSSAQQIKIVTGLPKSPRFAGLFQVDRPVNQLAVSDDGTLVVYALAEPESESLYAWTSVSGSAHFLSTTASVSGIAITQFGDAIVSDRGGNEVFAIWNAGGGAVRRLLADVREGVSSPMGVAVSSGNRIYIANGGASTAMVLDFSGQLLRSHSCSCTISGVFPLRDSVFRLTDRIDQTTFLLDATSTEERIVFVPPPLE